MDSKKRTLRRLGIAGIATATATIGIPALAGASTVASHPAEAAAPAALSAPSAPTGLKATDTAAGQITLSWTAPSGTVSGYNVYQGTASGAENLTTPINGNVLITGTTTTVTGLTTGDTYYFVVTAVNAAGQSDASSEASAAASAIVNSAPTALTAVPSAGAVTLNWTAPSTGDQPTEYQVYEGTTAGSEPTLAAAISASGGNAPATTAYIEGLNDGTTYYFVVKAVNGAGPSPASTEVSATPGTALVPPAPTATASAGNGSITVSWSEPGNSSGTTANNNHVSGYNVYEGSATGGESSTPLNGSIPITGNTITVPGTNGTAEYFTVKAVNSTGTSPASNEVSATPAPSAAPSAPTLSGTAGYDAVTLKWTPPTSSGNSKVTSYQVYDYNTSSSNSSSASPVGSATSSTSETVGSLNSSDTYGFFVVATNANGEVGSHSNTVSLRPNQTSAPSAPSR